MAPLLVVLVLGGTAWAYDAEDHITQAPNNKGDVLIFPWYLALDNGWQTKFTVVNTSESRYTVAKLVIRSFKYSEELLDFFLYLSPADVWTGVIRYDADQGAIVIYSTDDSALISTNPVTFASPEEPINQPMFPVVCEDDSDFLGYVEVIMAAVGKEYYNDITDPCESNETDAKPGMTKKTIYDEYALFLGGECYNMDYPDWKDGVLAGWMDFQNPSLGLTSSLRATTLKEYENRKDIQITEETILGEGANNSVTEIEAALSKNYIALPYLNNTDVTLHFFTFPTKLADYKNCKPDSASLFFLDNADAGCIKYKITTYDLKEAYPKSGSPFSGGDSTVNKFCDEVNVVGSPAFPYAEGWAHYILTNKSGGDLVTLGWSKKTEEYLLSQEPGKDQTHFYDKDGKKKSVDLRYYGAPVLATYLNLGTTGLSLEYGAWSDGKVQSVTEWDKGDQEVESYFNMDDYQYTEEHYFNEP
jgi:hypothetical protein